jgi:hypothetical protein
MWGCVSWRLHLFSGYSIGAGISASCRLGIDHQDVLKRERLYAMLMGHSPIAASN